LGVFGKKINKYVLMRNITTCGQVWFVLMVHYRFVNTSQVLLCKSNWWELENMENELNNTHVPWEKGVWRI
jgi:hypothetical protein